MNCMIREIGEELLVPRDVAESFADRAIFCRSFYLGNSKNATNIDKFHVGLLFRIPVQQGELEPSDTALYEAKWVDPKIALSMNLESWSRAAWFYLEDYAYPTNRRM